MHPTRFRGGMSSPAGLFTPYVFEAKVVGHNLVNWTVDLNSAQDQKHYTDVQVGSPYAHFHSGEGFFAMPDLGAKCLACIPSDTAPPCVLAFIMPFQTLDTAAADAPQGTTSRSSLNRNPVTASFAGNRPRVKGGDMGIRGRDGNFVLLHRGGVLQVGGGMLAQRLYIPLTNTITDICENMAQHTDGGTIYWGLQPTSDETKLPTGFMQTFRLFANNKYADVRLKACRVTDPIKKSGDFDLEQDLPMGSVVYDLSIAPQGYEVETGAVHDASRLNLRFSFDETGNVLLASKGSLSINFKKDVFIRTEGLLSVNARKMSLSVKEGLVMDGGDLTHVRGKVVKLGPGSAPVAFQGSTVTVLFPFTPSPASPTPMQLVGTVDDGRQEVLV